MAILTRLSKYTDTALLLLRIGIGSSMAAFHGYPKLVGGPEKWTKLGGSMSHFGIKVYPEIFGFLAAVSESIGAVLIVLGFLFRPSAFFLLCTMIVAALSHIYDGDSLKDASHAIEFAFVFLAMFIIGPGAYSIDKK